MTAIHKGPGRRTPRTRAIEIGTIPQGFEGAVDYCAQCGHPLDPSIPHGHYQHELGHGMDEEGPKPIQSTPFETR